MKTRKLLTWSEGKVDDILLRRLEGTRYRILVNIRLCDAIGKEPGEILPRDEFDFLTRAHLDFLIVTNSRPADPVFAVEFDGPHHTDPIQIKRDILKNRLCKKANLPLLRIQLSEIQEHDKVTLLDYMLDRYLSWQREEKGILREIREFVQELDPREARRRFEESDPTVDPSFIFDLRHPFPPTKAVNQRLLQKYRIAHEHSRLSDHANAQYVYNISRAYDGPDENEEYHKSVRHVVLQERTSRPGRIVYKAEVSASVRAWLPTGTEIPDPPPWFSAEVIEDIEAAYDTMLRRIEAMWFPDLPGISSWDIAEHFVEYLACRAVERWAEQNIVKRQKGSLTKHST
jgi:hypothetical protein